MVASEICRVIRAVCCDTCLSVDREKNNGRRQSMKRSETFARALNVLSTTKKPVVDILVGQRFTGSLLYTRNSFAAARRFDHEQRRPRPCGNYSRSRDEKNFLGPWSLFVLFTVCFQFPGRKREKKKWKSFWWEWTLPVGDRRVEIDSSSACDQCRAYVLSGRGANYITRPLYQLFSIVAWNRTLFFQYVKHVGSPKYLKILRPRCNAPPHSR